MNEMRLKEIEREFEFFGKIPNDTTDFADLLEAAKDYHAKSGDFFDIKNEIRWNAGDILESAGNIQVESSDISKRCDLAIEVAELNELPIEFIELFSEQIEFIRQSFIKINQDAKVIKELGGTIKTEVS